MHNYVQTSVMVKKQFAAAALVVSLLYILELAADSQCMTVLIK